MGLKNLNTSKSFGLMFELTFTTFGSSGEPVAFTRNHQHMTQAAKCANGLCEFANQRRLQAWLKWEKAKSSQRQPSHAIIELSSFIIETRSNA
eukprot:1371244-Amphidinium_carterae.2